MNRKCYWLSSIVLFTGILSANAQNAIIKGTLKHSLDVIPYANVSIQGTNHGSVTDANGSYILKGLSNGEHVIIASGMGFKSTSKKISLTSSTDTTINFLLKEDPTELQEIVITGTMKPVLKLESPVPVEVYTQEFFKANPTPSVYEALQNVNG